MICVTINGFSSYGYDTVEDAYQEVCNSNIRFKSQYQERVGKEMVWYFLDKHGNIRATINWETYR